MVVVESVRQGTFVIVGMLTLSPAQSGNPQTVRQVDNHCWGVALMSVSPGASLEKVHIWNAVRPLFAIGCITFARLQHIIARYIDVQFRKHILTCGSVLLIHHCIIVQYSVPQTFLHEGIPKIIFISRGTSTYAKFTVQKEVRAESAIQLTAKLMWRKRICKELLV